VKSATLLLALIGLLASVPATAGDLEVEHYSSNPEMQLPFSDAVKVGDMIPVKVISIDDQNRIRLSLKAAQPDSQSNTSDGSEDSNRRASDKRNHNSSRPRRGDGERKHKRESEGNRRNHSNHNRD